MKRRNVKLPNLYQCPVCGATSVYMETHIHTVGGCDMPVPFVLVVV